MHKNRVRETEREKVRYRNRYIKDRENRARQTRETRDT